MGPLNYKEWEYGTVTFYYIFNFTRPVTDRKIL